MPASNELFSFNDIATAVASGTMAWSGAAQSGSYGITWAQFKTYVLYDGTNPSGYADNQCIPYSYGTARAIVRPTGVSLNSNINCSLCTFGVSGFWGSRPAGWSAYVNFAGSGVVNLGQVDSYSWTVDNVSANYSFTVYYSNGTNTTPSVTSNTLVVGNCPGCPS